MPYVVLAVFLLVVTGLAWRSARSGRRADGCCAPADPADDLRMRALFEERD